MTDRPMVDRQPMLHPSDRSAVVVILGVLLAVIVLLGTWFLVAGGIGRASITINDHTDNAVPTVDLRVPARPVTG